MTCVAAKKTMRFFLRLATSKASLSKFLYILSNVAALMNLPVASSGYSGISLPNCRGIKRAFYYKRIQRLSFPFERVQPFFRRILYLTVLVFSDYDIEFFAIKAACKPANLFFRVKKPGKIAFYADNGLFFHLLFCVLSINLLATGIRPCWLNNITFHGASQAEKVKIPTIA